MSILKLAHLQNPPNDCVTEESGQYLQEGDYAINWFEGDSNPPIEILPIEEADDDLLLYQSDSDADNFKEVLE